MRTPAPLAPEDPTHAGRFRLLGRLAQGGMGLVYLARRDDSPDSLVALKMIRPELAHDPLLRARFAHEVAAAQRLGVGGETHVVRTVAADPTAARPWLATEYVPGPSLAEEVAARPQTPARVLDVAHALAAAIAAMHDAGLLHGDIKPSNVVLGPDGLRLVDLGLAREHTDDDGGTRFGSPGWSAPEIGRGAEVGPAVDVHGWGMTVAFAATGRPAFGGGTAAEVRERMRTTGPDLQDVPGMLRAPVAAALDPDPARRPTAPELLAQVDAVRAAATSPSDQGSATVPEIDATGAWAGPTLLDAFAEDDAAPRRSSLLPVLAVVAAVLGVVLLSAVALAAFGGGRAPLAEPSATTSIPDARASATAAPAADTPTRQASPPARDVATTAPAVQVAAKPTPDKAKGKKGGNPHGPGKPKKK